jgi:hypothetical protein
MSLDAWYIDEVVPQPTKNAVAKIAINAFIIFLLLIIIKIGIE